jgi:hypothetical protein
MGRDLKNKTMVIEYAVSKISKDSVGNGQEGILTHPQVP